MFGLPVYLVLSQALLMLFVIGREEEEEEIMALKTRKQKRLKNPANPNNFVKDSTCSTGQLAAKLQFCQKIIVWIGVDRHDLGSQATTFTSSLL